ncbi:DUF6504 family protein [Nonomuraea sp. NPDC001684]
MEVGGSVEVVTEPAGDDPAYPAGRPVSLRWARRGRPLRTYRVLEVLEAWATTRQWWREDLPFDAPLDVWHYRVQAQSERGEGILTLSVDVARGRWLLTGFGD